MTVWNIVASFVAGCLGAMGFGGGGILILYLTMFLNMEQLQAQGVNLLFFLPMAAVAVLLHSRHHLIAWRAVGRVLLAALPGLILGFYLTKRIPGNVLAKVFGVLLICIGLQMLFKKSKEKP